MRHGDKITVVLKHAANAVGKLRIVHTTVYATPGVVRSIAAVGETFQANHDDRPEHLVSDLGITWLDGHVSFDGPEAFALLENAKIADAEELAWERLVRERDAAVVAWNKEHPVGTLVAGRHWRVKDGKQEEDDVHGKTTSAAYLDGMNAVVDLEGRRGVPIYQVKPPDGSSPALRLNKVKKNTNKETGE